MIRVLQDTHTETACLIDTETETAFGPIVSGRKEIERFCYFIADHYRGMRAVPVEIRSQFAIAPSTPASEIRGQYEGWLSDRRAELTTIFVESDQAWGVQDTDDRIASKDLSGDTVRFASAEVAQNRIDSGHFDWMFCDCY